MTTEQTLTQMISNSTRVTENSSSLIDLVFSSYVSRFESVGYLEVALSDHHLVHGIRAEKVQIKHNVREIQNFTKCDHEELL